jgi:regulatory protein
MEIESESAKKSEKAYDRAIKLLSIRAHTSFELARKLKQKGFAQAGIDEAIKRLTEERFLKDEDAAYSYAMSLINHKTFGYFGIKAKLMQKGLPNNLVESILAENFPLEAEAKIAQKYLEKTGKTGIKAAAGLKSKGFRTEVISRLNLDRYESASD